MATFNRILYSYIDNEPNVCMYCGSENKYIIELFGDDDEFIYADIECAKKQLPVQQQLMLKREFPKFIGNSKEYLMTKIKMYNVYSDEIRFLESCGLEFLLKEGGLSVIYAKIISGKILSAEDIKLLKRKVNHYKQNPTMVREVITGMTYNVAKQRKSDVIVKLIRLLKRIQHKEKNIAPINLPEDHDYYKVSRIIELVEETTQFSEMQIQVVNDIIKKYK